MPMTDADKIRILVATDSHVGYQERDPVRKDDSWQSFDEVMRLATTKDVDMVLLAGDLFHDNKPSRKAMYQVMRSLRMNCLGEKPCELEMLCDTNDVFDGSFNHVNYEDRDINVAIPVFSIHGNHDDPSGDGHYSALDLLQVSGLLNYFGRTPESDNLSIKPILLQKGKTKLALYGMSNVRDERLYRTFRDGKVKFFTPGVQKNDWFNLMAVHQNHHAHTDTGYLPENFLPEWLDLVVWGHEHECLIDPKKNPETGFHVMQPGSSVATSLVPGEAVAKHVAIVTITGKEFEVENHRLKSVRPFITKEIKLSNQKEFKGLEKMKDNKQKVIKKLREIVEAMIDQARNEWLEVQDDDFDEESEEVPKPLVRLRVEYSSPEGKFEIENPQRFSSYFAGKVANTSDVVQFYKKKTGQTRKKEEGDMPEEGVLASLSVDTIKIDRLVHEFLEVQSLKILPQAPFGDAVTQFVVKKELHAIDMFVAESLADQVQEMLKLEPDAEEDDITEAMEARKAVLEEMFNKGNAKTKKKVKKFHPRPDRWDSDMDGEWEEQHQAIYWVDEDEATPAPPTKRKPRSAFADDDDDDDMESVTVVEPAKKAPTKRAPAKKAAPKKTPAAKAPARGRKKAVAVVSDNDDDSDVMMLEEEPVPKKTQPKRAAATRGAGAKQTQLTFSQAGKSTQKNEQSEDEISDDDDAFAPAVSQQSSRRK